MLVTSQMIWEELQEQKKLIMKIINKEAQFSIEEVSLAKAAKLLRIGQETVLKEVQRGNLKARVYRDNTRKKRYRFRLADIREFQETEKYDHVSLDEVEVESIAQLRKRVFGY